MSGAKCPISEWPSDENRRASKARLPVFCRHDFQARNLAGRFCPISGAKCPISEWPYGENRRASKARLPVFCRHGFQARHLVRARSAQRLLEPHAGNPPRGCSRCTLPARAHTKLTAVVHGAPRGHLTRGNSNELARQTLAHIDVILGNISLRLWVLGKGQRHREGARCLCSDAPRRAGNPRFEASTFSRRNF